MAEVAVRYVCDVGESDDVRVYPTRSGRDDVSDDTIGLVICGLLAV